MDEYKIWLKQKKVKQFVSAVFFIAILVLGWRYPVLGFFIPLCMGFGMAIGFFRGRKWCDWYCPRGSFYDSLARFISPQRQMPLLFRNIKFRLGLLLFLMAIMSINLILRWPDLPQIGVFFVIMVNATTVIGIILAVFFHQRSWCMLCPIGTSVNLMSRNNKYTLKIDSGLCIDCKLCAKVCPVQIKPYSYKAEGLRKITDADCLKCANCVRVCPKKALKF